MTTERLYNIWVHEPEGWQLLEANLDHDEAVEHTDQYFELGCTGAEYVMLSDGVTPVGPSIGSAS